MSVSEIFENMDYGPAPESDDQAIAWLDKHGRKFGLFINGQWDMSGVRHFYSYNPANGERLAELTQGTGDDVDRAVQAAQKAGKKWRALSGHERAKSLYGLARLVQKHSRILAVLESIDNGKPIRETRDIDIPLVARHFYYHAGWAQLRDEELAGYEPLGVAGQIIPWNFPLLMLAWKVAPALAAGNTVVLKPAEQTPLTALYFCELCQKAGVPPGVVNIITGDGITGKALVAHDGIDKIAFTGSTEVGKFIRRETAGTGKELTLELGGKSPFIVFDDADIDTAVEGVVDAIWFNQGEVCCAGSRLLVAEGIAEDFYARLQARMAKLRLGDPLDKTIDLGSLVSETQRKRVDGLLKQGAKEGGEVFQPDIPLPNKGCYFLPTLVTNIEPANILAREEVFGPVLAAMTFRTPDEAVALANNSMYGLAASIWSQNIDVALDVAARVKAGVVWVNSTNQFDAACGFGGYRQSGFGREGGREGMLAYLRPVGKRAVSTPSAKKLTPEAPFEVRQFDAPDNYDRTAKNYIGGKQARPDGGQVTEIAGPGKALIAEVGRGNRKDIRNAVEAARKAAGWGKTSAHLRAQIVYFIAENLSVRKDEFATRLIEASGYSKAEARAEVDKAMERLFAFAGIADKFDGAVHSPPVRDIAIAMHEPLGIIGVVCPQKQPLLGLVTLMASAIAAGNRAVIVPSDVAPLSAVDLYQVLETSDVPAGVVNLITGDHHELGMVLAEHEEVDALWYFGRPGRIAEMEAASASNLKQTWTHRDRQFDFDRARAALFMEKATQVKNIWVPYGA